MDGVEYILYDRLVSFICELAGDWRDNPGLGCTPESLEFEMTKKLPEWMKTNEMVRGGANIIFCFVFLLLKHKNINRYLRIVRE
jgi:hypothetical protein